MSQPSQDEIAFKLAVLHELLPRCESQMFWLRQQFDQWSVRLFRERGAEHTFARSSCPVLVDVLSSRLRIIYSLYQMYDRYRLKITGCLTELEQLLEEDTHPAEF